MAQWSVESHLSKSNKPRSCAGAYSLSLGADPAAADEPYTTGIRPNPRQDGAFLAPIFEEPKVSLSLAHYVHARP
jgi:hypothetical protein